MAQYKLVEVLKIILLFYQVNLLLSNYNDITYFTCYSEVCLANNAIESGRAISKIFGVGHKIIWGSLNHHKIQ